MCKTSVALGSFDGLHPGHQSVLSSALSLAGDGVTPVALLFDVHPLAVLRGAAPPLLLTDAQRDATLRAMGFDIHTVSFAAVHDMAPEAFFAQVLCGQMRADALSCGYNYRFGRDGRGDVGLLRRLCAESGMRLHVSEPVLFEGEPISSTRIRMAVEEGDMQTAQALLGRPFSVAGEVIHGSENGRMLGYPTANQALPAGLVAPRFGVYASHLFWQGRRYDAVTNIGVRPTLPDDIPGAETHILDMQTDLYGQQIEVFLDRFLRPERKFGSLREVFDQVAQDVREAYRR